MIEKLSKKQKKILKFAVNDVPYLICDGAVRSGKTVVMTMAFVIWAMEYYNKTNFAICSKTVENAERNVLLPLTTSDELPYKFSYNGKRKMLTVSIGKRENYFYLFGGKDQSSYTLVQGITLAGALLDEVALMPQNFVDQVMARTLTFPKAKIWFNCNPENQLHWFNQTWIIPADEGKKNAIHLHFTMDDNPIMTEEAKERTREMFSGVFYDRYILGLWCMAEGIIYDMFDRARHVVPNDIETEGDMYISSDYGIQNATTFLLWQKEKGGKRWILKREYYYSGREQSKQKTVKELVDGLESIMPVANNTIIKPRQVIVDPSAAALIVELRKRHYHVLPAINDVIDGISDVSTMLDQEQMAVCASCTHTIDEFGIYAWDAKAAQHGDDKPIKDNDHCMDAVRYFVRTKHLVRKL